MKEMENNNISSETKDNVKKKTKLSSGGKRYRKLGLIGVPLVALVVVCAVLFYSIFGNNVVYAQGDLMKDITPSKVNVENLGDAFIKSSADFSIDLFKESMTEGKNSLISPASVYLALAMTGNGADGETLKEFESVLGKYGLTMDGINKYCYSYASFLTDIKTGEFNIANSIWYRDDDSLTVNKDFLQTNADYYGASAYKADFNSSRTVEEINNWVKSNTNNLINKIVDKIDPDTVMYLINTLYFESDWQDQYSKGDVKSADFMLGSGTAVSTEFMYSSESAYLKDEMAQGFIKPYNDDKYSFAALLPNEGISVDSYVSTLTGEKFLSLIRNKTDAAVNAGLPKFISPYSKSLVAPLKAMGLRECFEDEANLSKMGSSGKGKLFIGDILHKTFIRVDELGTKAGAVTKVEVNLTSMPMEVKNVILNRPFVYAVIDNETGLPVFIGVMHNPQ